MILLSCVCALISALAIAVVGLWQKYAAATPGQDMAQEKALYARFVADIDRRTAHGDLDADMAGEERAEAARALLRARDGRGVFHQEVKPAVAIGILAFVVALAYGAYMLFGHPMLGDQPYAARLAQWTTMAQNNPDSVEPQAMAAVLKQRQGLYGNKAEFWLLSGRYDLAAGLYYDAAKAFERARTLAPDRFAAWSELGEALTYVAKGTPGADAQAAFAKALALDPKDARAHYYLGRLAMTQGRYGDAADDFGMTLSQLAPDDARRTTVNDQMKAARQAQAAATQTSARIAGMMAALAAQLKASPDNPDGWARLLRSYTVMGNAQAHDQALSAMRAEYHDRPAIAADIELRAQAAVGAENAGGGQ